MESQYKSDRKLKSLPYEKFLKINYKTKKIKNYKSLLNWSIKQPKYFWSSIWDFAKVYGEKKEKIKLSKNLYQSKFLFNSKLNFAENMLLQKKKLGKNFIIIQVRLFHF